MKKKSMLLPVVLLGISLFSTVNAYAEGWQQSGSNWIYLDVNNNRVTNAWKKGADGKWRWLDGSGQMAKSAWVDDDKYYVDGDGVYAQNSWKKIGDSWYYFDAQGKKLTSKWYKINERWYYFDDLGAMGQGWLLEDMYYTGDDGVMRIGWQKLYPPGDDASSHSGPAVESGDGMFWYYFSSNGKKFVPEQNGSPNGERKIEGKTYILSSDGALQTGWVNISDKDTSELSILDFRYCNTDGTLRTGWYSIQPPEILEDRYDDPVEWFYFSSRGVPKAAEDDRYRVSDLVKSNDRSYLFDRLGNPVHGLQKLYVGDSDRYESYYFGTKSESHLQRGKKTVEEPGGEKVNYYFLESSGKGFTGVKDSHLYYKGRLQRSDAMAKYTVFSVPNDNGTGFVNYVVNSSGKIVKNTKVKDSSGVEYRTNTNGVLTHMDNSTSGINGSFEQPVEPEYESFR